ncbi:hypothetical protein SLEP1_g3789 [Rubroshorea leprosula]|uniref:Uncharacterized protein n=1 Tax=Rubroshorea leprosula TaxID=152421 RepID=A0AAV5HVB5_9ROSI|nr:hypothetical protein SLEP1_g3789 [Rubroshorea leprosula]
MPQIILEADDERERCFNPKDEIVSKVIEYETSLKSKSSLVYLVENYRVLDHVLLKPIGREERACSTPRDHWMPMLGVEGKKSGITLLPEFLTRRTWVCSPSNSLSSKDGKISSSLWMTANGIRQMPSEMNKFLDAASGVGIPKKKGKVVNARVVEGRDGGSFTSQPNAQAPTVSQPRSLEAEIVIKAREDELVAIKRRRVEKDLKNSYQKRKICEDELEKKEKELDKVRKATIELELQVRHFVEGHIVDFLKSSTFKNIVNLYRLLTTIVAFTNCQNKVKLQYPEVDVTKITFGDQEGKVKENRESSIVDFRPKVELKWDRDIKGRTVFLPNFDFKFVMVDDEENGGANKPEQPAE